MFIYEHATVRRKHMKKLGTLFLSIMLSISIINTKVYAKEPAPAVSADSAVLLDAATGEVLYSKNMNEAYPPASTTKVMTALLTLEKAKLDDMVTVGKKVPYVDGSKIGLAEDEQLSVKDALYGLILMSGNDCAESLAAHVGGSIENFTAMMNARAKELGCENTNFVNPHGLYDENHKTSAKDLALIMREVVKHPEFRQIASTFAYKIPPTNKHPEGINLGNENKLINKNSMYYYSAAEAGKTGYTTQSLFSYVASASKNGQRLIVALVHNPSKTYYEESKRLLEYGFNNFELLKLYNKGDVVATISEKDLNIPLTAAEDYYYVKEKNSSAVPDTSVIKEELSDKSFKKGDDIAEASITLNNKNLPNLKLATGVDHEINSVFNSAALTSTSGRSLNVYLFIASLLALAFLTVIASIRKSRKRNRNNIFKK
jgi:serine-type D-Ala-D-Ala carboxypeptidase (penicillin-binding protein 5/6)